MNRLTADKPKTNYERLSNYCTINRDGYAALRYAGVKYDIMLHEYAAKCCKERGCEHMTANFVIKSGLLGCYDCPIAIMYYCGVQAAGNNAELAAYEDTGLEPKEIKDNEQIIADLTRAVCLKDVKIKRLKALLKKAKDLAISDLCEVCNTKCVNAGMNEDKPTERCGCFKWKHADEVEEVLKDEV